jgi:hypothetical protein
MTQKQRIEQFIRHVSRCSGAFQASSTGVYCTCGGSTPFGICGGMYWNDSATRFIAKYGVRFAPAEVQAKYNRMQHNWERYVRLAHKAIDCHKYESAANLCSSAEHLRNEITSRRTIYYHLKTDLQEKGK